MGHAMGQAGKTGDERSARPATGWILARPDDVTIHGALGAHDDHGIGHLRDAGDGQLEQAAALHIA